MTPIVTAEFYAVECDACGQIPDRDEYTYWSDQDAALDTIDDDGGIVLNLKDYEILAICSSCTYEYAKTFPDFEEGGDSNLVAFEAVHYGQEPQTSAARACNGVSPNLRIGRITRLRAPCARHASAGQARLRAPCARHASAGQAVSCGISPRGGR